MSRQQTMTGIWFPQLAAAGARAGQLEMAFGPRFRLPLAAPGITPATAHGATASG